MAYNSSKNILLSICWSHKQSTKKSKYWEKNSRSNTDNTMPLVAFRAWKYVAILYLGCDGSDEGKCLCQKQ